MADFIQLKNDNILRLGIRTPDGKETGEYLEFDLEDIELPIRYQEILEEDKKNLQTLKSRLIIIEKQQDHKGKKLMSANEEQKIKALNDYYHREVEIFNKFLGENGVQKLLNGRKIGWTTLQEINEIISEQIAPKLNGTMRNIEEKIKEKYKNKQSDVIE